MNQNKDVTISVLEYPESVRLRVGMYLMNSNHAVQEIIDNALDEFTAGDGSEIYINYDSREKRITVRDRGRGIPVAPSEHPKHKGVPSAELALCGVHAGGKFGDARENSYKTVTTGLNGLGAAATNATSSEFDVTIKRDKTVYRMRCQKGIIKQHLTKVGTTTAKDTGTEISFILDPEIWDDELDLKKLAQRVKQIAYLNPGLTVRLIIDNEEKVYSFPDGLKQYISDLLKNTTPLTDTIILSSQKDDCHVDLAFAYADNYRSELFSFVNNVATERAGDHLTGFKSGLHKSVSTYVDKNDVKKMKDITQDDVLEGITAIVSVKVKDPRFEGQGKTAIRMPRLRAIVSDIVSQAFFEYLSKNPAVAKKICEKISAAAHARVAAKKARDNARTAKEHLSNIVLPGKLTSCTSRKSEECEIFIVEGDSAGGTVEQGRDPKTQAVLPVFGKILNAEKTRPDAVLSSVKILELIKALGCGYGESFDINKLRYHKIIIMADADSDGGHISSLWITFFARFFPELIKHEHLYIAVSPLYSLNNKRTGIAEKYVYTQDEMDNTDATGYGVTHYKGLGELSSDQLWETTLNPETRHLIKVVDTDEEENSAAIQVCMAKDVAPRKEFILTAVNFNEEVIA